MHVLENDQLRVSISDHGAELSGIFDKKKKKIIEKSSGMQILHTGSDMLRFFFPM